MESLAEMDFINKLKGVNVKDVDAQVFIKAFAQHLKQTGKFKSPEWTEYVKSATHKELAPNDPDWLYTRAASIGRLVYLKGKGIGVATLRRHYSSKKRNGVLKNHTKIATGKIIRYCLKELQRLGLIETIEIKVEDDAGKVENLCSAGRRCTKRGKMDLDRIAANIYHAKNQ